MWWMAMLYPPYIAFVAGWYWLLARAELVKLAAESEGFKARIYRLMALEGLKAYLYQRLPLEKNLPVISFGKDGPVAEFRRR
jgi:hypothetical protein